MDKLIGAIEAGGTKLVLALARADGTMLARARIATRAPAKCFPEVAAFFRQASATHGPLGAIGVASFGPIDVDPDSPSYGTFAATPKPGWAGARWADALGEFGVPLAIDTDVNGAAIGEWASGAGKGCASLAYTTVGTGIGTGVISGGVPLRGFSHYEAGHIPVARDPTDRFGGICPFHGDCLEGLAAGPAIAARWGDRQSAIVEAPGRIDLIAGYLGQLAANLILLHMPERLVFGGGVMKAPGLLPALRRATERRLAGYVRDRRLEPGLESFIVAPTLGDDAGIIGAVILGKVRIP